MILPLFVPYYNEIPQVSGTTFGGISVSAKSMNYILGLQVIASSSSNIIIGLSSIVSILDFDREKYIALLLQAEKNGKET